MIHKDFLNLQEASRLCGCTDDHLALLCRQGRLKSKRFGKRWFLTKEWLEEYFNGERFESGQVKKIQPIVNPGSSDDGGINIDHELEKINKEINREGIGEKARKIGNIVKVANIKFKSLVKSPLLVPSLIFSLLLLSVTFASFDPTPSLHTAKNFAGEAYNEHLAKHIVFIKEDLQPLTAKMHQARLAVGQVAGFWSKTRDNLTGFWGDVFGDEDQYVEAKYRYDFEDDNQPLRLGLIVEEAPEEILSAEKGGVDLYKLSTFVLAGVQELNLRLSQLEQNSNQPNSSDSSNVFDVILEWFKDKILVVREFVADRVTTKELCLEEVCVDKEQLKALLQEAGVSKAPVDIATSTPETIEPESEPVVEQATSTPVDISTTTPAE